MCRGMNMDLFRQKFCFKCVVSDGIKSPFSLPRMISNSPQLRTQLQTVTNTISVKTVIISVFIFGPGTCVL